MTTYWTYGPVTWGADEPLNAHITRKILQDNLQTVYGDDTYVNSGSDHHSRVFNDAEISQATSTSWQWITDYPSFFVPAYQAQGGEWRDYEVYLDAKGTANTTARVYLMSWPGPGEIDTVTGDVTGCTAYGSYTLAAGYTSPLASDTITLDGLGRLVAEGLYIPGFWIHVAAVIDAGTGTIEVRSIRIQELV